MKFKPLACPICGEIPRGTLETLHGIAHMNIDQKTGEAEYDGWTEVWWDEQMSDQDSQGRYLLACRNGHEWPAEREDSLEADQSIEITATHVCWGRSRSANGGPLQRRN